MQTHSGIISLIVFSFCLTISSFAERPNVLIISIDDMNDWVGVLGGHPDAHTPNIDRLAERGTLFANAHTAAPVCNPSRAALISGLGPYRTGIYHNQDTLNLSEAMGKSVYLTRHFHDQGYYTMLAGKLFHGRLPDTEDALGLDEYAGDFGGMNFKLFADDYPYPFQDLYGIHNFAVHWGGLEGEKAEQLSDPQIADWAVSRLEQVYDQPFFLAAGFYRPHTPLISPKEFYDLFDREEIALPPLNPNDLDDMPWMGRQVAIAGYQAMSGGHYKNIVERGYQRDIVKGYLAACAFVDAQIGKVLDALDRSPHRDNKIVVLFSDHGWGMGERYHFKKWGLWDDTTRVPLVIHAPGISKAGHQSDHGVSLIDIYPTLVDLCGIETPPQEFDCTTLRPLLENPSAHWEKPTLTTFGQNNHALRTDRWRYIRWSDGSEELYDHALTAWQKPYPIEVKNPDGSEAEISRHWDPDCFLIGDTYYAISGGHEQPLFKSTDLKNWTYVGPFLSHQSDDMVLGEDVSCPNFFQLGDKWMLLCISHSHGCRYYLGDWDTEKEQFVPETHGRMNWPRSDQGPHRREPPAFVLPQADFFAPESVLTDDGRRVMWAWLATLDERIDQKTIQSLPRELSIAEDGTLRIRPLRELESLRGDRKVFEAITVPIDQVAWGLHNRQRITELNGDAHELRLTVSRDQAHRKRFGLHLFTGEGSEGLPVVIDPARKTLQVGSTEAPFAVADLPGDESVELRIFIDKYLVEVFVNGRQAMVAAHLDWQAHRGIDAYTYGTATTFEKIQIWKLKPTNEGYHVARKNRIWQPDSQ